MEKCDVTDHEYEKDILTGRTMCVICGDVLKVPCNHDAKPESGIEGSYRRCRHCNVKMFEKKIWIAR